MRSRNHIFIVDMIRLVNTPISLKGYDFEYSSSQILLKNKIYQIEDYVEKEEKKHLKYYRWFLST